MKKTILTLLICAAACAASPKKCPASPPPQNPSGLNKLCGLWQRVWMAPKDSTFVPMGVGEYKMISTDGTYFVFHILPVPVEGDSSKLSMATTILHSGNYEITSDSTYTEYVTGSHMGYMKETPIIDLNYKWIDSDTIGIDCGARGYPKRLRELWFRIKLFDSSEPDDRWQPVSPGLPKTE